MHELRKSVDPVIKSITTESLAGRPTVAGCALPGAAKKQKRPLGLKHQGLKPLLFLVQMSGLKP
jgi:hypothetical protein